MFNKEEFDQLNTAMSALSESRFREFNISPLKDSNYVVSISLLDGQTIRDTWTRSNRFLNPTGLNTRLLPHDPIHKKKSVTGYGILLRIVSISDLLNARRHSVFTLPPLPRVSMKAEDDSSSDASNIRRPSWRPDVQ